MKQAVILAAGEGQRLRPFTVSKPKAMLTIAGKPIMQYVVEALAQNGVREIIVVVGYHKEQVFDYLGSGRQLGVELTYVTQEKQLGTAHVLAQAKGKVGKEFLVLHGDNLIDADTIAQFVNEKPKAMLVKRIANPVQYGVVIAEDGIIRNIVEKPREAQSNLIDTGIYAFDSEVMTFVEKELDMPSALLRMMAEGYTIRAVETPGTWLDAVYPWDLLSLNDIVLRRHTIHLGGVIESGVTISGSVSVGRNTVIRPNSYILGPVIIGEGCQIGPSVCILPSTSIGNNVAIGAFSQVSNSVIGRDTSIGPGSVIQDSVIDRGCVIRGHFTASSDSAEIKVDGEYHTVTVGAMLGENCSLASGVVAEPGVIVGNHSVVKTSKSISGRLPDKSLVI